MISAPEGSEKEREGEEGQTNLVLNLDGLLGRHHHRGAVVRGLELNALLTKSEKEFRGWRRDRGRRRNLGDLSELEERDHLEAARVGEDVALPGHELVQAPHLRHHVWAWSVA